MKIANQFLDINILRQNDIKNSVKNDINNNNLKKVCNDFEAFFMSQLLDISLKSSKIAGEGVGADIIKGLYTENISKQSAGSLGISDMLYKFLSENKK